MILAQRIRYKGKFMNLIEIKNTEKKLNVLKEEVLSRINLIDKDKRRISNPLPESSDDQAVTHEADEVVDRLDEQERLELRDIENALKRIETGIFGKCTSCGVEIESKRLQAVPYAAKCIECANESSIETSV
jgi:RNA polymerase-binding transcription factor DksA